MFELKICLDTAPFISFCSSAWVAMDTFNVVSETVWLSVSFICLPLQYFIRRQESCDGALRVRRVCSRLLGVNDGIDSAGVLKYTVETAVVLEGR